MNNILENELVRKIGVVYNILMEKHTCLWGHGIQHALCDSTCHCLCKPQEPRFQPPERKESIKADCGCGICWEHASEGNKNDTVKFQGWPRIDNKPPSTAVPHDDRRKGCCGINEDHFSTAGCDPLQQMAPCDQPMNHHKGCDCQKPNMIMSECDVCGKMVDLTTLNDCKKPDTAKCECHRHQGLRDMRIDASAKCGLCGEVGHRCSDQDKPNGDAVDRCPHGVEAIMIYPCNDCLAKLNNVGRSVGSEAG